MRAKRAFEESERVARENELQTAIRKAKQVEALEVARKKQFLEREIMMAEQAKAERDSFLRVIEKQRQSEEHDRQLDDERRKAKLSHAQCIKDQILNNGDVKKLNRLDFMEEGRKLRAKMDGERVKIESIKIQKLGSLQEIGIEEKYQAELARKKV